MIKFIDIIADKVTEDSKESIKKTYHTYSCYYIVKFLKKVNRTQMVERIRGIKSVTIVDLRGDEKLDKINRGLTDYEYSSVEVKFVTNKNPKLQAEYIRKAMVKSDRKSGIDNIIGIVAAKAKLDTLVKMEK
jgi:hypothetical protein